ncbi:MAG: hypothetical protein ACXVB1_17970, partial [Pseudobdellovibrionaceae bacterium]
MPTSKILVLSFLSLSLWNLTSCTIPAPQLRNPEDSANATFLITDARGDALTAPLTKDFATPQSKTFTFTVCLKDRAQSRPLIGHSFRIEEINKELKSDAKGCLNWSEDVPFNFLSAPKYVEWKRQITATGLHKGTQTAHFAINPWNDNDNSQAVVNLETVTPPQLVSEPEQIRTVLKGNSEGASPVKNSLWINSLNLQSYEQKFTSEGVILNFELMTVPQLQIYKLNGETMFRSLSQGHFKVTFYLIHLLRENNQEVHRLLAQSVPQTVEMKGGNLFIKYPLKLQSRPPQGQLILGLDISGDGQDKNLGNFQGIYMIGDYDQFKGTKGLRLMNVVTESNDFKISSYINSNLSEDKGAYVQPRIEISPLEFKYLRVGKESTADREIIYNIKACFKNGLDQKSLQGVAFNVHGFRQSSTDPVKTLSLTADNSSCINWDESLTFKYYECHRHLTGFIEIENQDLAVQQKLEVALNPWEPTGSFARNLLKKEDHDNLITDCKKENILPSMMSLKTM